MTKLLAKALLIVACLAAAGGAAARGKVDCAWGYTDERYSEPGQFPRSKDVKPSIELSAWRGERVNAQLVAVNLGQDSVEASFSVSPPRDNVSIRAGWVEDVLADSFCDCASHDIDEFGKRLMPDRISREHRRLIAPQTARGAWLTLFVPQDIEAGTYEGSVSVSVGGEEFTLPYQLRVVDRVLPPACEWGFHLDLWQNPYAVARYHGVQPWSDEHLELMRPLMEELASAGQKVVTATLTARPWNSQTEDPFGSMVTWIKRADGSWLYDFTVFDRWVEFMASCGIDQQINCYSMIPWRLSFEYFDQATNSLQELSCAPGEEAYDDFWGGMLRELARHLEAKGWLSKTCIAMDERQPEQMRKAMDLIHSAAPGLGISLAGNYHPDIEAELRDYCVDISQLEGLPPEVIERRRGEKLVTTFYTCCSCERPNTFTFSPPAEAELLPLLAAAHGLDGYLRWAYNSWTLEPAVDSRFRSWPSGDCYLVYPFCETSVRWERLVEGIQQVEKWRLLGGEQKLIAPLAQPQPLPSLKRRLRQLHTNLNR
ncbi:MAG: DUF4091 domain-containing protein [Prevotellaceae bacterium]|nr:DUF4091 domain-containing protein [Prevotellaceae bacterium]